MKKRIGLGFALACALAVMGTRIGWTPACVLYTPEDAMYWILGCWYDPPPGDPQG